MLYSMTGFGRSEQRIGDKSFLVELRSLNGKQFDLRLNIPSLLKPYEFEIRNLLNEGLSRGTVECIITLKDNGNAKPVTINTTLAKTYFQSINELAEDLHIGKENILATLLKMPDIVINTNQALSEEEWNGFAGILRQAIASMDEHRKNEGNVLEKDLLKRIENIESLQPLVAQHESGRKNKIKENLEKLLKEYLGTDKYDAGRLEQELIYYIEKIDIHEEQVRLKNHCDYFREILQEKGISKGKKLGFVLQEIGREINTTGSKAYNSDIQKLIVVMKDELEKAKEQVLNIL